MSDKTFGLAGVMGWPVGHSRSPKIHNHWIEKHGLNGAYVLLPVAPGTLDVAVPGLAALGFRGCNITIPHKVDAMALVHEVDPMARRMGAMNTIVVQKDGSLKGFNNDGFGYIQSLLDAKPDWRADAGPVTVLGAGGAARAVVLSLADRGAREIRLLNRTLATSQALAAEFGGPVKALPWEDRGNAGTPVARCRRSAQPSSRADRATIMLLHIGCFQGRAVDHDFIEATVKESIGRPFGTAGTETSHSRIVRLVAGFKASDQFTVDV